MQKRIMAVLGSPRKRGNSSALAQQVMAGAKEAGAEVDMYFLHFMDIKPCNACNACRKKGNNGCVIKDDMKILYSKLKSADAVVIASPIYWFTISAQTKLFMDRWYAFGGEKRYEELSKKKFGIVLTYADADPFVSGAVNALRTLQDAINYIGAKIIGMVYGKATKAGDIRRNKALMNEAYELGKKIALI